VKLAGNVNTQRNIEVNTGDQYGNLI